MSLDNNDPSLYEQAILDLASLAEGMTEQLFELPSDWLEKNFLIPRPRDLVTADFLPPGPIRLADHQKRIINEALSRNSKGYLNYATVIYSAPKKSGKSALTSGVVLYMAHKNPYSNCYLLANDGKQSDDRLYQPIFNCINMHKSNGGLLQKAKALEDGKATLANRSKIEAIPCDARGEAGSEPLITAYSELWGYMDQKKRSLYTEMTIPSTLYGLAIRWIESYAGYVGQSDLLYDLYQLGVKKGVPHPDFLDLVGRDGEPVVWVNEQARLFCYWDTVGRMAWQSEESYQEEALMHSPAEFSRIHQNQWISGAGVYIQPEWWDACQDDIVMPLEIGSDVPIVLGVDAAVSGDCAAIVAVTRHPLHPETDIAVRYCKIFKPEHGKNINIEQDIGGEIRKLCSWWNIVCVAYDNYQMESLIQNYKRGIVVVPEDEVAGMNLDARHQYILLAGKTVQVWYYKFSQHQPRAEADKRLYDMIMSRQVHWNPTDLGSDIVEQGTKETLTKHLKQAGSKTSDGKMRIEKLSNDTKVDAAVALSMANHRCMTMNIENRELQSENMIRQLQKGEITMQQFEDKMKLIRSAARTRNG